MNIKKFLSNNSSMIFSILSGAGLITTTTFAIKDTPKAIKLIEERKKKENKETLNKKEIIETVWKCYIPTMIFAGTTLTCIVSSAVANKKQQASILSAYFLLEKSYKEYKKKAISLYGEEGNKKIIEEVVKENYDKNNIMPSNGEDTILFYNDFYGGYFERSMLEVMDAEYQLNRKLAQKKEVVLNDFFEFLCLETTTTGEILGWNQEESFEDFEYNWIEFEHVLAKMEDGMECYIIDFVNQPSIVNPPF